MMLTPGFDWQIAQTVFDEQIVLKMAVPDSSTTKRLYIPLSAPQRREGVVLLVLQQKPIYDTVTRKQLLEFAVFRIASTIEQIRLKENSQEKLLKNRSDQIRNTILTALSHDIRTPLAESSTWCDSLLKKAQDFAEIKELAEDINK